MEITYHKEGDYQIPDLVVEKQEKVNLGMYGRARMKFLMEHKRGTWAEMMMLGTLTKHLVEIDQTANSRVKEIVQELAEQNQVNEQMKRKDPLLWVQNMNNFKNQAEEIVYQELIYN